MPDKHEVGGSSPLGPTSKQKSLHKMFIENRINKRNETDSCIMILIKESHREKLVIKKFIKGFSVQVKG